MKDGTSAITNCTWEICWE